MPQNVLSIIKAHIIILVPGHEVPSDVHGDDDFIIFLIIIIIIITIMMIVIILTYIIILVPGHEVLGDVDGENVGEKLFVVGLQVLHLLLLLCK